MKKYLLEKILKNSVDWTEEDLTHFYNCCQTLCDLEALTFKTDEKKTEIKQYKDLLEPYRSKLIELNSSLKKDSIFRLFVGSYACLIEWAHNHQISRNDSNLEDKISIESPLGTYFELQNR